MVHEAADEVLAEFRANPPEGLDPRVLAEIRNTIARHSQDADEMPDPERTRCAQRCSRRSTCDVLRRSGRR